MPFATGASPQSVVIRCSDRGQLMGNPRDALPLPLFLPFQLLVIEWQLGHISLRFDGILLLAFPSM